MSQATQINQGISNKNLKSLSFSTVRSFLMGVAALLVVASPSQAAEYNFGGVQVFFDTTVSAGVSMRIAERNKMFLPEGNGGPVENQADVTTIPLTNSPAAQLAPVDGSANTAFAQAIGGSSKITLDQAAAVSKIGENYDGSINTDDGRLNFDRGDLTSGVIKMTNDIQASYENYTLFARVTSFYDAVLNEDSSYARSKIGDGAKVDAGRDVDLLDLYVSADYNIGGLPLNLRAGRQVINWGEGTFILNGINTIAPIDVNAFRRPGVEIKEGLLPVWALYGSIGLPFDLSLEAFYQLQWEEYQLDRPGTPFAGSDVARIGSLAGGNVDGGSMIGGGPNTGGFQQRNCVTPDALSRTLDAAFLAAGQTDKVCGDEGTNPYVDYTTGYPIGQNELWRYKLQGRADIRRTADIEADDSGQYGIAARWYSEALNSTEFGFYFMNYHSRLPIASERVDYDASKLQYTSYLLAGKNVDGAGRGAANAGCNGAAAAIPGSASPFGGALLGANAAKALYLNSIVIPNGRAIFDAAEALLPAAPAFDYTGAVAGDARSLAFPSLNGNPGLAQAVGGTINKYSLLHAALLNCALVRLQSNAADVLGGAVKAGSLAADGTEIIVPNAPKGKWTPIGLYLEYPEDIKLYGFSFNTTVGDWGVQGEVAYRDDQPLQLDTDQITIAALGNMCLLDGLLGPDTVSAQIDSMQTYGAAGVCGSTPLVDGKFTTILSGVKREEVWTAQIGTTATYTRSHPVVEALGADIGILVTELGGMWVPDVPDEGDFTKQQLVNVCTAGSDLPAGGFLALDPRKGCRPTSMSYGYVLLGSLQYNNAFGTAVTLSPTVTWSHDVKGNSPAPLSNYREGRKRVSLSVTGSYQNTWRGTLAYTNFFGNEKYSKAGDKDFVSANISYSF